MSLFIETAIGGLTLSGLYFLIAVGVTIVFGQTRNINFAHGQFLVFAALLTWEFVNNRGYPYVPAVILAVVIVAGMAFVMDALLLRRLGDNAFASFLVTLGVLLLLQQGSVEIWGPSSQQLRPVVIGRWVIGDIFVPRADVVIVIVAAALTVGLFTLLQRSRFGRSVRASAEDPLAASHLGVPVRRVAGATFVGGTALAALAGGLMALIFPISPFDGGFFIIKGFAVALVAGLGSVPGAGLAALVLGMSETMGQAYWRTEWVPAISFVLIIGILVLRPSGFFGRKAAATEMAGGFVPPPVPRYRPWTTVVFAALLGFGIFLPVAVGSFQGRTIAGFAALFAIQACAVGLFYRLTGELSFVHGAFWGVGAYMGAYASREWGWGFWTVLPLAIVAAMVVAFVVGAVILRTTGLQFLLVGFVATDFLALLLVNWRSVTGGTSGITVIESPGSVFGFAFFDPRELYQLFFALLLVALALVWWIQRTPFAARLMAARDNVVLARSLGQPVRLNKLLAFALTAGLSGVSGVAYLYQNFSVAPSLFTGLATVAFPLMVILGGSRSLLGPVAGAFVLGYIPFWFDLGPGPTQLAHGIALVIVMLLLPQGVVPTVVRLLNAAPGRLRAALETLRRTPGARSRRPEVDGRRYGARRQGRSAERGER
ncbi:MAG: ABC transporter permease [bacterium]|nr:ABC transporter permease [bacterium]